MLTLREFDQFAGRLAGWDGAAARWEYPGVREPIRFRSQGIRWMRPTRSGRVRVGIAVSRVQNTLVVYFDGRLARRLRFMA